MNGDITLCFYIVVGLSVAVAVWVLDTSPDRISRVFRASMAIAFWPMYLPQLLIANRTRSSDVDPVEAEDRLQAHHPDELDCAMSEAETDLDRALESLAHWPDVASFVEVDRFADLRLAWSRKAIEIRDLNRLLTTSEIHAPCTSTEPPFTTSDPNRAAEMHDDNADRIASSEQARREHLAELNVVCQQWHGDLLASLAQVRQLATQIHLARYTGKPASRAAEVVQQIAHTAVGLEPGANQSVNDRQPSTNTADGAAL